MSSTGSAAIGAAGALIAALALIDLFVTVFNYDGFSFIATRLHGALWRLLREGTRLVPTRVRHSTLSLGSAGMLPATYVLWLGLEIVGFALMFTPGLAAGRFTLQHVSAGIGSAFYLSAGAISSLTFGDVVPVGGLDRALSVLETIVGLTTFTIALGYVVTTFDVLRTLDGLHATVRRHAPAPDRPASILARHFRGGEPSELPALLGQLIDKLGNYDQGLRRYPVAYYFHTRRLERSIPRVFASLGDLLALLAWGLPADESLTSDPLLAALIDEYATTLERLRRSFVGPPEIEPPEPLDEASFLRRYHAADPDDGSVADFRELRRRAQSCAGISEPADAEAADVYRQYREWLPFAYRKRVVLERVADALGYDHP